MTQPASSQPWQLGPVGTPQPKPATDKAAAPAARPPMAPPAKPNRPEGKPVAPEAKRDAARRETELDPASPKADPEPRSFMPAPRRSRSRQKVLALSAAVLALGGLAGAGYFVWTGQASTAPVSAASIDASEGTATVISRPEGARVLINGQVRGVTPLTLTLPVGTHTLELQSGETARAVPLLIESGSAVRQYVDLAPGGTATGSLQITSDPDGAQVIVDGEPAGVTPLLLEQVAPGEHVVALSRDGTVVNRTVEVAAGTTATVVASMAPTGAAGGWVAIEAPFEVQIFENGSLLGTSTTERLMLPAGSHELELVSSAYEFQAVQTVRVQAGRTVALAAELPMGTLSVSALPWAEVWIDGEAKGATPLGNLDVPIGNHEVLWRHPELGERRQTVRVTAVSPVRVGMDMNQ